MKADHSRAHVSSSGSGKIHSFHVEITPKLAWAVKPLIIIRIALRVPEALTMRSWLVGALPLLGSFLLACIIF